MNNATVLQINKQEKSFLEHAENYTISCSALPRHKRGHEGWKTWSLISLQMYWLISFGNWWVELMLSTLIAPALLRTQGQEKDRVYRTAAAIEQSVTWMHSQSFHVI